MKPQVALVPCADYSPDAIDTSLEHLLSLLGGLESFVRPGHKVLIKPTLLAAARRGEGSGRGLPGDRHATAGREGERHS